MTLNRRELLQQGNRGGWEVMASMLPDDVLLAQAAYRGFEVKKLATDETEEPVSSPQPESLAPIQEQIKEFLNPELRLGTSEQLAVMRDVLAAFGQAMPMPPMEQVKTLVRRLGEHPEWRVVPTRLDEPWNRRPNAKRSDGSVLASILPSSRDLIWAPENQRGPYSEVWHPLWKPEGGPIRDKGWIFDPKNKELGLHSPDKLYELRYRTPDGRYVNRSRYKTSLLVSGQAVLAPDDSVWIYPVMDVSDRPSQKGYRGLEHSVAELHRRTDPIISPEALINLHLLYRIVGRPKDEDVVDMTNEVISEVDAAGNHQKVVGVVFVTHSNKKDLIRVAWENGLSDAGDFQAIEGVSGIGVPSLPPRALAA